MSAVDRQVRVYSLPDCPKCDQLKEWLKENGITFEARWFDTEAQTNFIMRNMFGNPPILEAGDTLKPSEDIFEKDQLKEEELLEVFKVG
jgi:glutaredoxin